MQKLREFCLDMQMPALWRAPMSDYSTFRIGGCADALVFPDSEEELLRLLVFLKAEGIPFRVLGNASNLLFSDSGFRGALVTTRHVRSVSTLGNTVRAASGTPIKVLCRTMADASLDGLASLYGIPATVGGAVFMNAGAFGGEEEKRAGVLSQKVVKVFIIGDVQKMPIIQARALQLAVVDAKTQRLHQVQARAGGGTGAGNVSGVLRDLRLHQYNVQCWHKDLTDS